MKAEGFTMVMPESEGKSMLLEEKNLRMKIK